MNESEYGNGGGTPIFDLGGLADYGATTDDPYRDAPGSGGYTYRQYASGKIIIIGAPAGKKTGTVLTSGPAYDAIVKEIGPYPTAEEAKKKGIKISSEQASGLVSGLLGVFTSLTSKEATPVATTYTPSSMSIQTTAAPAPTTNYTPYIIGGVVLALVAFVGIGAFALTRKPAAPPYPYPPPPAAY